MYSLDIDIVSFLCLIVISWWIKIKLYFFLLLLTVLSSMSKPELLKDKHFQNEEFSPCLYWDSSISFTILMSLFHSPVSGSRTLRYPLAEDCFYFVHQYGCYIPTSFQILLKMSGILLVFIGLVRFIVIWLAPWGVVSRWELFKL